MKVRGSSVLGWWWFLEGGISAEGREDVTGNILEEAAGVKDIEKFVE